MKLKDYIRPLTESDCIYTENADRIYTYLTLMDYDWMHYRIQAEIPVADNKILAVEFLYIGSAECYMTIELEDERCQIAFNTSIFNKYFKRYLEGEIKTAHHGELAFYGGDIIIEFWNEIINNHQNITTDINRIDPIIFPKQA